MAPHTEAGNRGGHSGRTALLLVLLGAALLPAAAHAWQCETIEPFERVAREMPIVAHLRMVSRFDEFAGEPVADLPFGPGEAEVLRTLKGELPERVTLLRAFAVGSEAVIALHPVEAPVPYLPRSWKSTDRKPDGSLPTLVPPPHTYSDGRQFLSCEEPFLLVQDGWVEGHVYMGTLNRIRFALGLRRRMEPHRRVPLSTVDSLRLD